MSAEDIRPDGPAELACQVAKELRRRGIWADTDDALDSVVVPRPAKAISMVQSKYYTMHSSGFDNLTSREIADVIQREEAKKAQEWAGDT